MAIKILISAPYMLPVIARFRPFLEAQGIEVIVPPVRERLEEQELLACIAGVHGVICGDDRFTARVLEAATELRVIAKWGTGIDSIDQAKCRELRIAVRNTPNAFSEPVADSVLGYMLCFARRLPWMNEAMHAGSWDKIPGRALGECTLGVIGVGDVGKAVVRRAVAFGMTVLGNDIATVDPGFVSGSGIRLVSRDELLREADFVSLNCDLNATSHHLIDAPALALMKSTAVVINTARGPIVDERALEKALAGGTLGGAALDTFEDEPLPADSPLRGMKNVILAPHNANSSPRAWEAVHRSTLNNLLRELAAAFPERRFNGLGPESGP
jgi:D-3-phosphoglycerate dehydrogenase